MRHSAFQFPGEALEGAFGMSLIFSCFFLIHAVHRLEFELEAQMQ